MPTCGGNIQQYNLGDVMDFRETRACKIISTVLVFLFTWTSIGPDSLALAAQSGNANISVKGISDKKPGKGPAAKLEDVLEGMRKTLQDEKVTRKDKKSRIKVLHEEAESQDGAIRAELKVMENSIKDKGLPAQTLKRHKKLVDHYEKNLTKLREHAKGLELASDSEFKAASDKALKFLEEVSPKRNYIPLDPNKLPRRIPETKQITPRTSDDEYKSLRASIQEDRPPANMPSVLLASNGSLAGLFGEGREYIELAMASGGPVAADLAENMEVKFTESITAQAAELGNDTVKIYEWVRNNVRFAPTYGSIQGADMCLQTMECNAMDTASLLIALLRVSGIPARYAYGTIEMPMEKAMNWAGGFTNPNAALNFFSSGGVPAKGLVEGGKLKYAQIEHVWVEAWVDMIPSMGTKNKEGDTWVPLDGSFKQYDHKPGMDLYPDMNINGVQYMVDYITNQSPLPSEPEPGSVFEGYVMSPAQFYSNRLFGVLDSKYPDAEIVDVFGDDRLKDSSKIISEGFPYLLGTLPYKLNSVGARYSSIPASNRPKVRFQLDDMLTYDTALNYTASLVDVANKRITLSYIPYSTYDEGTLNSYGGSLLDVPPAYISVKPVLKVDGIVVASGSEGSTLGYDQKLKIYFDLPNMGNDVVTNMVVIGDYTAIAIDYFKTPVETIASEMSELRGNLKSSDTDEKLGQLLYNIGISYFHHMSFEEDIYAKNFQMKVLREPSEALVIAETETTWMFGYPYKVAEGGMGVDIDRDISKPVALDGSSKRQRDFQILSGLGGSAWEDMVLWRYFGVQGISAATTLKKAYRSGIPVHMVDLANILTILPTLNVSEKVKNAIKNAVYTGKKVIVSESEVQIGQWKGACYIVVDPYTGSGGYMIEGGMSGGSSAGSVARDDSSIFLTSYTRLAVLMFAACLVGEPYVWGAEGNPSRKCGFDCSGFVHYVYTAAYGEDIFPRRFSSQSLNQYCWQQEGDPPGTSGWIEPIDSSVEGDIVWVDKWLFDGFDTVLTHPHVGIKSGPNKVIHASGYVCGEYTGPIAPGDMQCAANSFSLKRICGRGRVVETSFDGFQSDRSLTEDACRPMPN